MGIISLEQKDRLLWLGRYTERVYTTLKLYSNTYDTLIDGLGDSYASFCEKIDIPNVYADLKDFEEKYPFDEENPDSIMSNLIRAYDNAIVLREEIGSEALSYIQLAIYDMNKARVSRAPLLEIQRVIDNILAFWGVVDDSIDSRQVRSLIKTGKRIERIDLYARLGADKSELEREISRLEIRITRTGLDYDENLIKELKELVTSDKIDYYKIVSIVESIL